MAFIACFAEVYAGPVRAMTRLPAIDETLMTSPEPCDRMVGTTAWQQ